MARYTILAACLFAPGCVEQAGNGRGAQAGDALDIYEAVFRYRLQKFPANVPPAEVKAFLAVDGKDPPAELMKRLIKDWPNLKPVSEEPKEKGMRIYVERLQGGTRGMAVLHAGYWFPTKLAGEGYSGDHHLRREEDRWIVATVTNEISS